MKDKLAKIIEETVKEVLNGCYNITDREEIRNYSTQIWNILQFSYAKLGGFKSYSSQEDMAERISLATLQMDRGVIVACAIYRNDLGGQKMVGCGTIDGSKEHKKLLRKIIKDDIDVLTKYHWVEVSQPLEEWFKEEGGNPIPSRFAPSLLRKSKENILFLDDNVHYKRNLGLDGKLTTKSIYGFKDISTYEHVISRLEELTKFSEYKDFKSYVNSLPKLNEDIDYYENHPVPYISQSIEIIIQLEYLYDEDGIRELSPKMYHFLKSAVDTLKMYPNPNSQIEGCIRNGEFLLRNMTILNYKDYIDNILAPAI